MEASDEDTNQMWPASRMLKLNLKLLGGMPVTLSPNDAFARFGPYPQNLSWAIMQQWVQIRAICVWYLEITTAWQIGGNSLQDFCMV